MSAPSVAIIGTGFGGLAAAIELKQRGFDDLVIFERGADVGGVWRENTYPGAACDIPSPFYSFSFAPNPRWPRRFSQQPDILDYLRGIADTYDIRRHIRFDTEVTAAEFDEASNRWTLITDAGDVVHVDVLISAVGQLSRPAWPDLPGRDTFSGPTFHSAQWDHDVDLTGKRVAVIGTGASAIQFVPEIQKEVGQLSLFQRSAPYLLPRPDTEFTALHHNAFEKVPLTQLTERALWWALTETLSIAYLHSKPLSKVIERASRWHMSRQLASTDLMDKLWPDYPVGCKRILFSSNYLPALTQPNVDVVTDRIAEVTPTGVRTQDGVLHEVDVIIYGTGFTATDFLAPMKILGRDRRDLRDQWNDGAHAYLGMSVPDFPNLFLVYGPNTGLGSGSIVYMLEAQARYIAEAVGHLEPGQALAVRPEVEAHYDAEIQSGLVDGVWSQCSSWYRGANGRISTNWPHLASTYRRRTRQFRAGDYAVIDLPETP
ncbi:NAD(P)/FAD-dependent oxidoreductase [Nocardioides humilatus]|uniref:NAD(P)/FAD-dependent oxidoreductase n=1 Tax=Nocardioides humilatus TaxID=2607660 RepID=A0A5B1L8L6_9ACTN|nr:NAD(P)/FAD-dependent oxidoreductase [Nocardioides humilatus]KAA1416972.1 NAD(P)/FAD-dependent oxidoreductase [Nocardioides humilatus]